MAKHKPAPVPSETDRLLFGRAILFSGRAVLLVLCSEQCSGSSGRAVLCRALLWLLSVSSAHSGLISEVEHAALCSEQLPIYHWSKTICGCISTLDFYMCSALQYMLFEQFVVVFVVVFPSWTSMCVLCNMLFEQVEEEMDGGGFNLLPCLSFWVNFSEWKFLRAAQSGNFSGQNKVANGHGPTYLDTYHQFQ